MYSIESIFLAFFSKMKNLWKRAKQELILKLDTAKGMFGVKTVVFEPEIQEKIDVLEKMESNVKQLLLSFQLYISSTIKLISSSSVAIDVLSSSFQQADGSYFQNSMQVKDLLQKYTQINEEMTRTQVPNSCITPLVEFQQHIRSLHVILEKARKNKILFDATNREKDPEESQKLEDNFHKYQTAFCQGVDILSSKQTAVFCGIFNAHQYDLLSLISDLKTRLPTQVSEFPSSHVSNQLPSIESVLNDTQKAKTGTATTMNS